MSDGKIKRVLIVDDEKDILQLMKIVLEKLGLHVITADSSNEALELFVDLPDQFHLVITDYKMPHLNGVEFAKKVRSFRPDMPIILCTGFSDIINREDAKANGFQGYLEKPVRISEIASQVKSLLDIA